MSSHIDDQVLSPLSGIKLNLSSHLSSLDKIEASQIDLFLEETGGRCKKLAVEVKSVRSMLGEVVEAWKRYNACVDLLTVWLAEGEQVMKLSPEEKEVGHFNNTLSTVEVSIPKVFRVYDFFPVIQVIP